MLVLEIHIILETQGGSANTELVAHSHYGPVHDHPINTSFNISASGTTSVDDVPHTHPVAGTVGTGSGLNAGADYTGNYSPRSTNAATDTNHSHTFTINTTASLSGSTSNSGNLETSNAYDGNGNAEGNLVKPPTILLRFVTSSRMMRLYI